MRSMIDPIASLGQRRLFSQGFTRRQFLAAAAVASVSAMLPALGACASDAARPSTKAQDFRDACERGEEGYALFTDSCGREVALPTNVQSISPSGAYAQIMLTTLCPEKLISLSSRFSESQLSYLPSEIDGLPVLGRFYGGTNGDLNYEEIIKMSPDVIVDVGESKENIADDLDKLQEQTGLPVIFVEATLTHVAQAYRSLGSVLGCTEKAEELASYADKVLGFAEENRPVIEAGGLKVLYSGGAYGYEVKGKGTVHGAVLDLVGVQNVADLSGTNSTEVSPEQVMVWDPDVVLLSPADGFFDLIYADDTWAGVSAVKDKRVYEVPGEPYEWMDKPPSVQTLLGVLWLGNLLYPGIYSFDMVATAQEFYKLFWGYDLTESEARQLLANSTLL